MEDVQDQEELAHDLLRDYVCRCEEVSRSSVLQAIAEGNLTLNDIKRRTRAGMGPCQGIYCLRAVALMLESEAGIDLSTLSPMTARPPARLITLGSLATLDPEE